MKRITILGSTGSIGRSTLDVVAKNQDQFKVVALAAGRNIDLLEQQIKSFRPELVAVADRKTADSLHRKVRGIEILFGPEGISSIAAYKRSDFVLSSIVGAAGLMPTLAAIKAGKAIGLANKEALVMAGEIVMREARRRKIKIIPVDSEHSAIFQCVCGHNRDEVKRIILTASGGPFRNMKRKDLKNVSAKEALRHPKWSMGRKISIDSATLMNKGLEVIEASWLFNMRPDSIDVLIHPQSIVHSMVEFTDRSLIAQMSMPDMRGPISYALAHPRRLLDPIAPLDIEKIGSLTFSSPDFKTFPCLAYAYESLRAGGTVPCVLNAANEVAVSAFLSDRIGFTDIPRIVRKTIDSHDSNSSKLTMEAIFYADSQAREKAESLVRGLR